MAAKKMIISNKRDQIWIEMTSKERDWRECFAVVQRSFHEDPFYRMTHPDPEKRAKFLRTYMDWLYHCIFKDDRGLLVVIKCKDDTGKVKIIGGSANTVDEDEEASQDYTSLSEIDAEGWKRHKQRDEWEWAQYFPKLKKVADTVGTTLMHGVFQNIDDGYRGKGIGTKFVMESVKMMSDEVVRRKRRAGIKNPKPPLAYCVCDHARSRNFTKKCGFIEVGEVRNDSLDSTELENIWIFLYPPKDLTWVDLVRTEFGYIERSNL